MMKKYEKPLLFKLNKSLGGIASSFSKSYCYGGESK